MGISTNAVKAHDYQPVPNQHKYHIMELKISIIIPTYNSSEMAERTLQGLSSIILPDSLSDIIIVENGPKLDVEDICQRYRSSLPLTYVYTKKGGLSHARNLGIKHSESDVLIFFDNDMKFDKNTLVEYDKIIQQYGVECFYGGPVLADYESQPPEWLKRYFPWSAKGHSLGSKLITINEPVFLGGNHAIPKKLLDEYNGYDEMCATGDAGMIGEETRLQEKLLSSGNQGVYIPGAIVHHWIPKDRCSEEWTIQRNYRAGLTKGELIKQSLPDRACMFFGIPCYIAKEYLSLKIKIFQDLVLMKSPDMKFENEYKIAYLKGIISRFMHAHD